MAQIPRKAQNLEEFFSRNALALPVAADWRRPPVFHNWPPPIHRRSSKTYAQEVPSMAQLPRVTHALFPETPARAFL